MTMWPAADARVSRAHRVCLVVALIALCGLLIRATSAASAQEVEPEITPPAGAPELSLTFTELNDSGVSGIVTLSGAGDQTVVEIRVEDAGENHPAHIHMGGCGDLDPVPAFPLENAIDGVSTSLVDASLDELLGGGYSVDLHLSVNELGTLIVCAPIEGEPTEGTGGTEVTPTAEASPTEEGVGGIGSILGDGTGGALLAATDIASLPLQALDNLGVTGTASISAVDADQTDVIIQLTGDPIAGGHIAHLHLGTCDNLSDAYTLDLDPVDESGFSEATVDIPFDELLTDGYAINVHASAADYDTWFVCGEFGNATVGAVVPEVAPPTGSGEETSTPTPTVIPPALELPQTAGSGTGLLAPNSPISASLWAIITCGIILAVLAGVIRRGERDGHATTQRWRRLGL